MHTKHMTMYNSDGTLTCKYIDNNSNNFQLLEFEDFLLFCFKYLIFTLINIDKYFRFEKKSIDYSIMKLLIVVQNRSMDLHQLQNSAFNVMHAD